jgi:hypothetical protein|mmetsp:Transcript_22769/g.67061  ORF Transcript_22769/g.67061 Transcript_22769/m.67061 type:complete len:314 (-) Transcript_22769:508-1449(-)
MEAGNSPADALPQANALRGLVPGSPHLEHMPSHVDMLVGDFKRCMRANERAAMMPLVSQVYPLHNLESWLWCARLAGDRSEAARAVAPLDELANVLVLAGVPEAGFNVERFTAQSLLTMAHFGDWAAILAAPRPAPRFVFHVAVMHFARGMAAAHIGDGVGMAAEELRLLLRQCARLEIAQSVYGPLVMAANIYTHTLRAAIALSVSNASGAAQEAHFAAKLQGTLPYDEPPLLYAPVAVQFEALAAHFARHEGGQELSAVAATTKWKLLGRFEVLGSAAPLFSLSQLVASGGVMCIAVGLHCRRSSSGLVIL